MDACDLAVFRGGLRSPPKEPRASFGPPNTNRDSASTLAYNVTAMLRKTLTILSLLGLLLSAGLWGASYFHFLIWWPNNRVYLATGVLDWGQVVPSSTPFAWRCEGFHGFNLKRLKPSPPRDWGFRKAPPPGSGGGGTRQPNVALPGITIWWHRSVGTNGVMHWSYRALILLWIPTVVCGITLCLCRPLHHRRRSRFKKLGLCVKCGYNLKGLTEPRCPECNTSFDERLLEKDA